MRQTRSASTDIHLTARPRVWLILFLTTVCAAEMSSGAASVSADFGNSQPVPASYFSMNILFHPLNHVPWPSVPLGGWRTSHAAWADLQPEKDRWYFDLLDKYVGWSQQHHLPILMPLAYTPRWASSTPDAATDVQVNNPPGLSGAPRDMEDWRIFIRTVAVRYKGRIHDWEIWNEPNRPQSWTGSVDTMVEMTRDAAAILKEVDPQNRVVSPAPTGIYGLPFLDKFLSKGGGQYVDVIGYHFYVGKEDPPEAMIPLIEKVRGMMQKYGVASKPLWNTEAGWLGPTSFPPDVQAAYISRAFILNWVSGVSRFYWYAWENHRGSEIELTGPDNAALTSAGRAFSTTESWMTGAVLSRCESSADGTWICDMHNQGTTAHIVWNTKGNTTINLPSAWNAGHSTSLMGARAEIAGNSIAVGVQPSLIQ